MVNEINSLWFEDHAKAAALAHDKMLERRQVSIIMKQSEVDGRDELVWGWTVGWSEPCE